MSKRSAPSQFCPEEADGGFGAAELCALLTRRRNERPHFPKFVVTDDLANEIVKGLQLLAQSESFAGYYFMRTAVAMGQLRARLEQDHQRNLTAGEFRVLSGIDWSRVTMKDGRGDYIPSMLRISDLLREDKRVQNFVTRHDSGWHPAHVAHIRVFFTRKNWAAAKGRIGDAIDAGISLERPIKPDKSATDEYYKTRRGPDRYTPLQLRREVMTLKNANSYLRRKNALLSNKVETLEKELDDKNRTIRRLVRENEKSLLTN